jgi:lipopolysaccharide export system permease protein
MKILDRHVLASFLKNYLISFMVLIGLYVVLDMVFAFDEFAEVQDKVGGTGGTESALAVVRHIARYYFYRSFLIYVFLAGVIPVVAAAFTIIRLTRFNELTAVLAAGVPLLRMAAPIILMGFVLNIVLLPLDQELLIPRIIPQLTKKHDQIESESYWYPVKAMQDSQNRLLVAARYDPPAPGRPAKMTELSIIARDEQLRPLSHIAAETAVWDDRAEVWNLTNGRIVHGLLPHEQRTPEEPVEQYDSSITPEEIALYRSGDYVELLPTSRINQLLAREESYGVTDLQRVKHTRFTLPFLNFVLLLLAVGCLLTRDPSAIKGNLMRCAVLVGACMSATFLSQQLAGHPQGGPEWSAHWPAIMAWLPLMIFGPIAVWLLDRVKT